MQRTALVCAADENLGPLLAELVASLHAAAPAGVIGEALDICLMDLGLAPDRLGALAGQVQAVAEPDWDLDFPGRADMPPWFRAMTARPFLPEYFPGYDVYLWLDADTWVQDFSAVELLIDAATRADIGIVPEIDRAYGPMYGLGNAKANAEECYKLAFGEDMGGRLATLPLLNSGVLGISADSVVWERWRDHLKTALARAPHKLVEQASLNLALYEGGIGIQYLPSLCNWIVPFAPPRVDAKTGAFVEPFLPFSKIGILHLTGVADGILDTFDTNGQPLRVSYRFPGEV